jgi:hypothetical protein
VKKGQQHALPLSTVTATPTICNTMASTQTNNIEVDPEMVCWRTLNSCHAAKDISAGESRRHRLCNLGVRYWQYQSFLHSQPIRIREWYIFSRYYKFTGKFILRTLMMNPKAAGTTPTMERTRTCCQPTKYEIAAFLRHCAMRAR